MTHLPIAYLADPAIPLHSDMMDEESDSSEDEEEDKDRDIIMKESTPLASMNLQGDLSAIRARLELLYDSVRVDHLLYRFMKLASLDNTSEVIQSISSFFNTLMLRWPMKKDTILNTLLYKASNTHHLLQILWSSWSNSNEALLFKQGQSIMNQLPEAVKAITGTVLFFLIKKNWLIHSCE